GFETQSIGTAERQQSVQKGPAEQAMARPEAASEPNLVIYAPGNEVLAKLIGSRVAYLYYGVEPQLEQNKNQLPQDAGILVDLREIPRGFRDPLKTDLAAKIVSLGIQGKRQLNIGEKTVLRVRGRFSDGSETEVTKNLEWQSSDASVVAVSGSGQVEGRKDGFADITVRYEGIESPPLTLVVRKKSRATEADAARVASKVEEHIKAAGAYHDRGEYSTALAELAKAKLLDPSNKAVQAELERIKKACLAEQRIVSTSLRCD